MKQNFNNLTKEKTKNIALETLMEIKNITFSTIDADGNPASRIVDLMFKDGDAIYFFTCNVKPFYFELKKNETISITAMKDWTQVRLKASCKTVNRDLIKKIYQNNPGLKELFPDEDNSKHVEVFCIYRGKGELFDLSGDNSKMQRARFAFGGEKVRPSGCIITDKCINCGKCANVCPFNAISVVQEHHQINPVYCDECGMCYNTCPVDAIELPTGL